MHYLLLDQVPLVTTSDPGDDRECYPSLGVGYLTRKGSKDSYGPSKRKGTSGDRSEGPRWINRTKNQVKWQDRISGIMFGTTGSVIFGKGRVLVYCRRTSSREDRETDRTENKLRRLIWRWGSSNCSIKGFISVKKRILLETLVDNSVNVCGHRGSFLLVLVQYSIITISVPCRLRHFTVPHL